MLLSRFIIGLFFYLCASYSFAWSTSVHRDIGAEVYNLLSKKEKRYYKALTEYMPAKNLAFYDLSPWVDSVRSEPIFELFQSKVPVPLEPFPQRHSSNWHYENSAYFKPRERFHCALKNNGLLEKALLAIDDSLKTKLTKKQEAMLIAFAIHLMEDAHQPLHTGTLVRSDCSIDLGGNRYCLQKLSGKCALNLHRLWDGGFSASKAITISNELVATLSKEFHLDIEIQRILMEGEAQLASVYAIEENRAPYEEYINQSRFIAEDRLRKSVVRVTHFLKNHYDRKR